MRLFFRYLILLTVTIAISWLAIPRWLHLDFPQQAGPEFDKRARKTFITMLDNDKPDIVLLGDSTLMDGVDTEKLSEHIGKKASSFSAPGLASAYWYIVLKNSIVVAEHHPQAVVVVFRDTMLTAPGYRVYGAYFERIDEYARHQEPVLLERAYLNQMNPLEIWSEKHFPLYSAGETIRQKIDFRIRYTVPGWLNCDMDCTDSSMNAVFTAADLEPGQLRNAVATAESYLYTPAQLDFSRQVEKSFLPEMIRMTQKNGIQLIVVRIKHQTTGTNSMETPAAKKYIADLSKYLQDQGVSFLDYGQDPKLTSEYFKDMLHLNPQGRVVFTKILANGLNETLK
jgi:hypothetical protein